MVPRPEDLTVSHSNDRHSGQAGRGGWRRAPQFEHRWISSLPSLAPSKKNRLSWVIDGRGRLGRGAAASCASIASVGANAGVGSVSVLVGGRYLRMRKRMVATTAPCWSV